ncbi:MAG: SUMF1/EgtB/PvdO family nonheme iron enzyme [Leptolyngbyaceae bacterium]|nr:SUMF1/EgtB/PvdO family nonheme iron enzyme [Leptolyngbyaceae bacterium]
MACQRVALLVAVSEYGEGYQALPGTLHDLDLMERVLQDEEYGNFQVIKQVNPHPQLLRSEIERFFVRDRSPDDVLLFYFTGHGALDNATGTQLYLSTSETHKEGGRLVESSAVESDWLHRHLINSRSSQKIVILDCCFSGAIANWLQKGEGDINFQRLQAQGTVVLASSSAFEASYLAKGSVADPAQAQSVYTRYLLEGIQTGAARQGKAEWITARDLHEYAKQRVLTEIAAAPEPQIIVVEKEGYQIGVAKAPKGDPKTEFRQFVAGLLKEHDGVIPDLEKILFEIERENLGVSVDDAQAILKEQQKPYIIRRQKQGRYREAFLLVLESSRTYPLSATLNQRLKRIQQALGLTDTDAEQIQLPIVEERNLLYQVTEQVTNQTSGSAQKTPSAPPPPPGPSNSTVSPPSREETEQLQQPKTQPERPTSSFSFETAKITGIEKTGGLLGLGGQVRCTIKRQTLKTECFVENLASGITLDLVPIPAGEFWMGQTEAEKQELLKLVSEDDYQKYYASELPRHQVKVSAFWMGKFAVTQAQYEAVMGKNPATKYDGDRFVAPNKPVVGVTWDDAIAFCQKLSEKTGNQYRLPSEAEWEYACRADTETPFYFGDTITTELANYNGNYTYGSGPKGEYREKAIPVGSFPANKFGLFDMHGNVWEWCQDPWHENYQGAPTVGKAWEANGHKTLRLLRGGSWYNNPRFCRSANRSRLIADNEYSDIGFRVVCSSPRTL